MEDSNELRKWKEGRKGRWLKRDVKGITNKENKMSEWKVEKESCRRTNKWSKNCNIWNEIRVKRQRGRMEVKGRRGCMEGIKKDIGKDIKNKTNTKLAFENKS